MLSPMQIYSIHNSTARINIWCGSVRSGKTHSSLIKLLTLCKTAPEGPLAIIGRTNDTLKRNIVDQLYGLVGDHMKYWSGKREIDLFGRTVYVIGANDDRAEGKIRGATFSGAYVDEATLIPEGFFKMLLSRVSKTGAQILITTNPDSPFHWLKTDLIDRSDDLDLKVFNFTLKDNPSLDPAFVDNLKKEYSGLWYQRFIEGRWVLAEGCVYDFFDEKLHCIDMCPLPAEHYLVGIDYGTRNPTAFVMVGVNRSKYPNLWVEKEYYFDSLKEMRQKTDAEYAADLKKFCELKPVKTIYLDPSAASFKQELNRQGIGNVAEANNDVLNGIRTVSTLLTEGTLKVHRGCRNLIKEFQSYVWDERAQKRGVDDPKKEHDHAMDGLRYALHTAYPAGFNPNSSGYEQFAKARDKAMGYDDSLPRFFRN